MSDYFRSFIFLINIDSEIILKWFGMEDKLMSNNMDFESSTELSFDTFRLLIEGLWEKMQDGLTLPEIENILFFILFVRFVILALRYNIKTSFFITSIGLIAAYLWYKHLIGLISNYRFILLKLPFLHKLGVDVLELYYANQEASRENIQLREDFHWYNFGQMLYYGFKKGISYSDPKTGLVYYIDPISMIVSNLPEQLKLKVLPTYYNIYDRLIPQTANLFQQYWDEMSGIVAYALITRVGKRYCPYLIRWHWTLLLIIGILEPTLVSFMYRISYFQTFVLIPKSESFETNPSLIFEINLLNLLVVGIVAVHIGFVIFALFHAIWGQYFYIPFLVDNTELHVGPRPKNSIYSGGQTSWQDITEKEKNRQNIFPKVWYGWFGRGSKKGFSILNILKNLLKKINKNIKKLIKRKKL